LAEGDDMNCEFSETCSFCNKAIESKAVNLLRNVYCQRQPRGCALYMIMQTVGCEYVPSSLYPNQTHLVPSIIRSGE
jgi:hypothetical protein